jgi:hypothetical protein
MVYFQADSKAVQGAIEWQKTKQQERHCCPRTTVSDRQNSVSDFFTLRKSRLKPCTNNL